MEILEGLEIGAMYLKEDPEPIVQHQPTAFFKFLNAINVPCINKAILFYFYFKSVN